jgi:hypothetical protein
MPKVAELETAFYLRYSYTIRLRHIETGKVILFHPNLGAGSGSNLLSTQAAARTYLEAKEGSLIQTELSALTQNGFLLVLGKWKSRLL